MRQPLPDVFVQLPLAHRGFHDASSGRPENTRAAIEAAIEAGYGVEIDVQPSAEGVAMVFHDKYLNRLTHSSGKISETPTEHISRLTVLGSKETVPTLSDVLEIVDGQVPLLIELKDKDGRMAPALGRLETGVSNALEGYVGPVAVMSFNPASVAAMGRLQQTIPRGLATSEFRGLSWNPLALKRRAELKAIKDYDAVGASFISHDVAALENPRVAELKAAGAKVLCWTVTSQKQEDTARRVADNITFEGYSPALSSP